MKRLVALAVAVACMQCVEWTRLNGKVKAINLKDQTVTLENNEQDNLTVPVDYQVKIIVKKGNAIKRLQDIQLDDKVTLIRVISEKPKDDLEGLVPPRYPNQ